MAEGCPSLEHVDLFGCTSITDKAVIALARSCSWLKYLNLSNSRVTDKGIAALGKGCPGLVELIVEDCDNVSEGPAIDEMRAAGCRVFISLAVSVHTRSIIYDPQWVPGCIGGRDVGAADGPGHVDRTSINLAIISPQNWVP